MQKSTLEQAHGKITQLGYLAITVMTRNKLEQTRHFIFCLNRTCIQQVNTKNISGCASLQMFGVLENFSHFHFTCLLELCSVPNSYSKQTQEHLRQPNSGQASQELYHYVNSTEAYFNFLFRRQKDQSLKHVLKRLYDS